jgi:hypothetical protein
MISARIEFLPGILTPFVALAAILIMVLNFGCERASMGLYRERFSDFRHNLEQTHLIRCNKPFQRCIQPYFIGVRDYALGPFTQMGCKFRLRKCLCCVCGSCIASLDILCKMGNKPGRLAPFMVCRLDNL